MQKLFVQDHRDEDPRLTTLEAVFADMSLDWMDARDPEKGRQRTADMPMEVCQVYRGMNVRVVFYHGCFNGYVDDIVAHDPKTRKLFEDFTSEASEAFDNLLGEDLPHGGLTAYLGFDCHHLGDLWIRPHGKTFRIGGKSNPRSNVPGSFKTWRFALSETKRLVDGLLRLEKEKKIVLKRT